MDSKNCTRCKQTKSLDEFSWKNKTAQIKHYCCKSCMKQYNKAHYNNNKDVYIKNARTRNKKLLLSNRKKIFEHFKKNPCIDCGESNPVVLEFDHIDRKLKSFCVSKRVKDCSWAKLKKEIDKCEVRCANCHRIKTANELNYYSNLT